VNRFRYIGAVLLTALVLVFALQNLNAVPIDLLFWRASASVALIALAPFLVGLVVASAASFLRARKARTGELKAPKDMSELEPGGVTPEPPAGRGD
jgi:uncharacterized integral membrane protein